MPGYGHYRPFQEGLTRHLSSQGFLISYLSVGCRKGALHQETGGRLRRLQQLHVSYHDSQPKIFLSQFSSALETGHDSRGTSLTFCPTGYVNPVPDI